MFIVGHFRGTPRPEVFPFGEIQGATGEGRDTGHPTGEIAQTIRSRYGNGTGSHVVEVGTLRTHNDGKGFRKTSENVCPTIPARGVLKKYLGEPRYKYEPWWYGSPWTKQTALWGKFNIPERIYKNWEDVQKIPGLYTRPGRSKPSLAFMHKSHFRFIEEFQTLPEPENDMEFRSLCSQKFAKAFYEVNK